MAAGDDPSSSVPPSRPGRSPVLLILAGFAVAILIGLNVMSAQFRPKSDEELQKEAQDKAAAQASPTPSPAAPGAAAGSGLVSLSPDSKVGNTQAPEEVVLGFEWTPQVQADPNKVYQAVTMLQKAMPPVAHLRIVDVDLEPSVPEGISVGGKVIVPASADGSISLPPPAVGALIAQLRMPGGPPGPPPGAPPVK